VKIHNVRLGLACNSSSSHSLIILEDISGIKDDEAYTRNDQYDHGGDDFLRDMMQRIREKEEQEQQARIDSNGPIKEFGWNYFTVISQQSKLQYLGVMLAECLQRELPENFYNAILREWVGVVPSTESSDDNWSYIDHQSLMGLPCGFGTKLPDQEFFEELKTYILQENIVILGGNDNEDRVHPLHLQKHRPANIDLPRDGRSHFVARKDPKYNYWSMFWETGAKLRMSLGQPEGFSPTKAYAPELVDIKINDYCPFGCNFCYQGSTPDKGHADVHEIGTLARHLAKYKVFEVALGGGEPTLHPQFVEILESFRKVGIIPNFTTKNLAWLNDVTQWRPIMDYAGAFAYSADTAEDVEKLASLLKVNGISSTKASVQIVMGVVSQWEFKAIITACAFYSIRLTLLGFKRIGRGAEFEPNGYTWWLNIIQQLRKENKIGNLSVDTALAAEYEQEILDMGIPDYLFHTQEGKFSMYVDAVTKMAGPSSYCDPSEMIPWDFKKTEYLESSNYPTLDQVFEKF